MTHLNCIPLSIKETKYIVNNGNSKRLRKFKKVFQNISFPPCVKALPFLFSCTMYLASMVDAYYTIKDMQWLVKH